MKLDIRKVTQKFTLAAAALAVASVLSAPAAAVNPVTLRIASDTSGLPHPAAVAMEVLKDKVEEAIPGSQVRTFFSSSLYNIPQAVEAMTEGDLEMAWGQFGKTAQVDPYMNVVLGPMLLTTAGAINALDDTETYKMLARRLNDIHDIKVFGSAHLSYYMGAGSGSRMVKPEDFVGKKIRSTGPAENAMLGAFGASPTTMAFGDVPSALETRVIDGLLTSLGGFNSVKDQAPYFTVAGINGLIGDYYWIGASNKWWNKLDSEQQAIIEKIVIEEVLPWQKRANFCNDLALLRRFEAKTPAEPGIYVMTDAEAAAMAAKLGSATSDWIKANTPQGAHEWVDRFAMEAKAAVAANPKGSSWLEDTDCAEMEAVLARYTKG